MQSSTITAAFVGARPARWLSAWAAACFTAGLLLFAAQRQWLALDTSALPPAWRGSLPSFVHTYVFVLLACVWLATSWSKAFGLGLLFWCLDVLMEVLQLPRLHAVLGSGPLLRTGFGSTFDWSDLLALTLGLWSAWGTLALAQLRTRQQVVA